MATNSAATPFSSGIVPADDVPGTSHLQEGPDGATSAVATEVSADEPMNAIAGSNLFIIKTCQPVGTSASRACCIESRVRTLTIRRATLRNDWRYEIAPRTPDSLHLRHDDVLLRQAFINGFSGKTSRFEFRNHLVR